MPWSAPSSPLTVLGMVLGRTATIAASECLIRGCFVPLLVESLRSGLTSQVSPYLSFLLSN